MAGWLKCIFANILGVNLPVIDNGTALGGFSDSVLSDECNLPDWNIHGAKILAITLKFGTQLNLKNEKRIDKCKKKNLWLTMCLRKFLFTSMGK